MKTNNFKLLLLTSILLATSCTKTDNSSSESAQASETPAESSSVEESSSVVESSTVESSSSAEEQVENPKLKVTMNRRIYLRSEFESRKALGQSVLDYSEIAVWSEALQDFKTSSAAPVITIPEGSGNLKAKLTLGRMSTYIDIEVYDTAEDAAKAHPVSDEELKNAKFKEALYYSSAKKKTVYDTYYDEKTGRIMQATMSCPIDFIDDDIQFRTATYSWASRKTFGFSSTEKNTQYSVLDPTKHIATHEDLAHTVDYDEVRKVYVHNITESSKSGTYCFQKDDTITESAYVNDDNNGTVQYESEMIIDAEGRICYLGIVLNNKVYSHVALSDLDSYYVDPYYQTNDYSTKEGALANTNPAFIFGENYDPNDEVNKYDFEKVVPEGGYHFVNVNNYNSYSSEQGWDDLDNIWSAVTGLSSKLSDSVSYWNRESMAVDETGFNENVANRYIFYKNGQCTNSTVKYTKAIVVYDEADTYRKFAHLYKLAVDSGDDNLISKHDDVVNAIKYQQIDSIKAEEVLFNYYSSLTDSILSEWQAALIK